MQIRLRRMDWEYVTAFRIAYRTRTHAQTVWVELSDGERIGRGEALGVSYHGESVELLLQQLHEVAKTLEQGIERDRLQELLPPGGARNALDCALWDLEAKRRGCRVWDIVGITSVRPLLTAYTLGLDTPEAMAAVAAGVAKYPLLKLKLNGEDDLERVAAVHRARPDARLIVDANQAWNESQLRDWTAQLGTLGVELIEQPLPAGKDSALAGFSSPVPLCADEACQTTQSLPALAGKYEYVNIKLDKTGGLSEALRLAQAAKEQGFKLMVGCMGGSSLSMAPAFVVGQLCDIADLDGPLLAKTDGPNAIKYEGGRMPPPEPQLWG